MILIEYSYRFHFLIVLNGAHEASLPSCMGTKLLQVCNLLFAVVIHKWNTTRSK